MALVKKHTVRVKEDVVVKLDGVWQPLKAGDKYNSTDKIVLKHPKQFDSDNVEE